MAIVNIHAEVFLSHMSLYMFYLLCEVDLCHFVPEDLGGSCDTEKGHFYLHKLQTCQETKNLELHLR